MLSSECFLQKKVEMMISGCFVEVLAVWRVTRREDGKDMDCLGGKYNNCVHCFFVLSGVNL